MLQVTVNTCTCTDVFTVITTKDQSGGIYYSYSTGSQRFMTIVHKPRPPATTPFRLWSVYNKSLAPCYNYNVFLSGTYTRLLLLALLLVLRTCNNTDAVIFSV